MSAIDAGALKPAMAPYVSLSLVYVLIWMIRFVTCVKQGVQSYLIQMVVLTCIFQVRTR